MPINGMGYSNGQKVKQIGGNSGQFHRPSRTDKSGNIPAPSNSKKDGMMNGNHMPGAKYNR